jgi:hypothetical protein
MYTTYITVIKAIIESIDMSVIKAYMEITDIIVIKAIMDTSDITVIKFIRYITDISVFRMESRDISVITAIRTVQTMQTSLPYGTLWTSKAETRHCHQGHMDLTGNPAAHRPQSQPKESGRSQLSRPSSPLQT